MKINKIDNKMNKIYYVLFQTLKYQRVDIGNNETKIAGSLSFERKKKN